MSIIGKIFGSSKAVDSLLDKDKGLLARAGNWIDERGFTEQEKAENDLLVKEWGLRQLEALTPFKVVQRAGMLSVGVVWVLIIVNMMIAFWIDAFSDSAHLAALMAIAKSEFIFVPTSLVFGLYFGGGAWPRKSSS